MRRGPSKTGHVISQAEPDSVIPQDDALSECSGARQEVPRGETAAYDLGFDSNAQVVGAAGAIERPKSAVPLDGCSKKEKKRTVHCLFAHPSGQREAWQFPIETRIEEILASYSTKYPSLPEVVWLVNIQATDEVKVNRALTQLTFPSKKPISFAGSSTIATSAKRLSKARSRRALYRTVLALCSIVAYLLCGGAVFNAIESGPEQDDNKVAAAQLNSLMDALSDVTMGGCNQGSGPGSGAANSSNNSSNNSTTRHHGGRHGHGGRSLKPHHHHHGSQCSGAAVLTMYLQQIEDTYKNCHALSNTTNWDFAGSIFFSLTLITTVGYGNYAPGTDAGMVFAVLYSIVGIILFGFALYMINSFMWTPLFQIMNDKLLAKQTREKSPALSRRCAVIMSFAILVFYMLTISSLIVWREGWTFGESMYFMWITFSTIGLGDYTPANENTGGVWVVVSATTLGLSLVAALLGTLQQMVQDWDAEMAHKMSNMRSIHLSLERLHLDAIFSGTIKHSGDVKANDASM